MPRQGLSRSRAIILAVVGVLGIASAAFAQQQGHQVTGTVASPELAPLPGVSVLVRGTTIGTITNATGNFTLVAPSGDATLIFSALGRRPLEVSIAGRSVINVTLETQAIALEELVVVGYGQQARASVSGAVSTIGNDDIERTSSTTVADMLVGKLAGINTRMMPGGGTFAGRQPRDGRPGASTVLQIRNLGEPLFVIDGVPQSALEFNQLNASDIENISVLKDASASIYGFRAANGVVLVTTKRGGSEFRTPEVRVDGHYGWQFLDRSRSSFGYSNSAYQFRYSTIETQQNQGLPRTITPEEMELWRQEAPGYRNHEAWNYVINNPGAKQATVNASVSGAAANNTRYYLSLGHVTQDYVMRDNNFGRSNIQTNLSTDLFGGLSVGTELRGRLETHTTVAVTNTSSPTNVGDAMTVHFQSIQSTWPHQDPYANGNPNYVNGDVRYFIRSPVVMTRAMSGTQDQIRTNVSGNFWAEYALPFGTKVRGTYSRTSDLEEFDVHRYTFDGFCYDRETDTYNVCDTYNGQQRRSIRGVNVRNFGNLRASHDLRLGSHSFAAVAGAELSDEEGTESTLFSVPPNNFNPLIDYVDVQNAGTTWTVERRSSYFGRLNYDYQQKYLVETLGRYDGTHLYGPGNRWGFFPGVSVGWRLTEEAFFENALPFLNELKLRASWGQAGREQASPWAYLGGGTYGSGVPGVLDGRVITGIAPRGLPVTNLSWVTSTSRNVGVDFALLDHRLTGELDLFERKLSGIPAARYDVLLPNEVGYSLPNENLESEAVIGFDGMIRYSSRVGQVSYSIAPNFTLARPKILERYKPRYGNSWDEYRNATENRWTGVPAGFNLRVIGQFQSVEEILRYPVDIDGQGNRSLLPGDLIFEDVNGDGRISFTNADGGYDLRPLNFSQNTTPIFSFGFNGSFEYEGLSLNYDLAGGALYGWNPGSDLRIPYTSDHTGGAYIWSRWRRADPYDDNSEWVPGKFPPLRKAQNSHSSYRNSDFTYLNLKYVRVKRVELGYRLPGELSGRAGISNLRVYAASSNPFLLDNTKYAIDPEVTGCCGQLYPTLSVHTLGFSAAIGGAQASPAPVVPVPPSDSDN